MRAMTVLVCLAGATSLAQAAPSADVEQAWLDPAGRGSLLTGNGSTLARQAFRTGVSLFYAHGSLRGVADQASTLLVADRLGFQVFGAVGVLDWLELGVVVPVLAYQQGAAPLQLASAGLGNPWLTAKVNVLGRGAPLNLAFALGVAFPVGTPAAQGNGGLALAPRVQVGRVFDDWQVGAEVGALVRSPVDFGPVTGGLGDVVGSQLWLAAQVTSVSVAGPRGEASVRLLAPLGGGRAGVEAQVGLRWPVGPVELFASGGPGFGGEPATPFVRVFAGAAFANVAPTAPPCVEGRPYEVRDCPGLDLDGDGVRNGVDKAPGAAEDKDGFEDDDGAPDLDNDADGVADGADKCPLVAGVAANEGCADADADGDGVVDRLDACPAAAEDGDDFEDGDGCPEPDNDADGLPDASDACPSKAGLVQERGCPAKDTDGDQVSDHLDVCPADAGPADNAGCPAVKRRGVALTAERLVLREPLAFDAKKAGLQKRSLAALDEVAQALIAHPEIVLLRIEVRAGELPTPEANLTLSQARAEAVKAQVVKAGVAEARLQAVAGGAGEPGVAFVLGYQGP